MLNQSSFLGYKMATKTAILAANKKTTGTEKSRGYLLNGRSDWI
jgi:hypothetical protein